MTQTLSKPPASHRVCIAPMLDWTDAHCRFFLRLFSRHAFLYTEMVTTGALLYGDVKRHLRFNSEEHPVGLQLGGSDPSDLAAAARLGAEWGYDEINLNCGCPSERVQRGAFGACLMAEPELVASCVSAMCDAVALPITVKHRIGLNYDDDYGFVRDFVGTVGDAGCRTFIVHARNAVLKGLSPKQNRDVPPLKPHVAYQLKLDFPAYEFVINGGVKTLDEVENHLAHVDGVMIGREAYQNPSILSGVDTRFYDDDQPSLSVETMEARLLAYCQRAFAEGTPLNSVIRHTLGWHKGEPGARQWRRVLSDTPRLARADFSVFDDAREALRSARIDALTPTTSTCT